jgi:hypothetical protein
MVSCISMCQRVHVINLKQSEMEKRIRRAVKHLIISLKLSWDKLDIPNISK